MNRTVTIAPVRKEVRVRANQRHAFDTFTAGLDRWWPKTHHVGASPPRESVLECRLGGRWLERAGDGVETQVGTVLAWEPPARFVLAWQINPQWKADQTVASEIEVQFIAEGEHTTLVKLEHRKFEALGAEGGASMRKDVDGGWPTLLGLFVAEAERAGG